METHASGGRGMDSVPRLLGIGGGGAPTTNGHRAASLSEKKKQKEPARPRPPPPPVVEQPREEEGAAADDSRPKKAKKKSKKSKGPVSQLTKIKRQVSSAHRPPPPSGKSRKGAALLELPAQLHRNFLTACEQVLDEADRIKTKIEARERKTTSVVVEAGDLMMEVSEKSGGIVDPIRALEASAASTSAVDAAGGNGADSSIIPTSGRKRPRKYVKPPAAAAAPADEEFDDGPYARLFNDQADDEKGDADYKEKMPAVTPKKKSHKRAKTSDESVAAATTTTAAPHNTPGKKHTKRPPSDFQELGRRIQAWGTKLQGEVNQGIHEYNEAQNQYRELRRLVGQLQDRYHQNLHYHTIDLYKAYKYDASLTTGKVTVTNPFEQAYVAGQSASATAVAAGAGATPAPASSSRS